MRRLLLSSALILASHAAMAQNPYGFTHTETPPSNDSSFLVPNTSWVQALLTAAFAAPSFVNITATGTVTIGPNILAATGTNASTLGGTTTGSALADIYTQKLRVGQSTITLSGAGSASQTDSFLFGGGSLLTGTANTDPISAWYFVPQSAVQYMGRTTFKMIDEEPQLLWGWAGSHAGETINITSKTPPQGVVETTVNTTQGSPSATVVVNTPVNGTIAVNQGVAVSLVTGSTLAVPAWTYVSSVGACTTTCTVVLNNSSNQVLSAGTPIQFIGSIANNVTLTPGSSTLILPSTTLGDGTIIKTLDTVFGSNIVANTVATGPIEIGTVASVGVVSGSATLTVPSPLTLSNGSTITVGMGISDAAEFIPNNATVSSISGPTGGNYSVVMSAPATGTTTETVQFNTTNVFQGTGPYTVTINNAVTGSGSAFQANLGFGPATVFETAHRSIANCQHNMGGVGGAATQPYNFNGSCFASLLQANSQPGVPGLMSLVDEEADLSSQDPIPPLDRYAYHVVLQALDLTQAVRDDAAFGISAQGGWAGQGLKAGVQFGAQHGWWAMDPVYGWGMLAKVENEVGNIEVGGMQWAGAMDVSLTRCGTLCMHLPNFSVSPNGTVAAGAVTWTPDSAGGGTIASTLYTVTAAGISAAGNGYFNNDVVYDVYGDGFLLTVASAPGPVTGVTLLPGNRAQAGSAGSTTPATYSGNGSGFVPTLTWTAPGAATFQGNVVSTSAVVAAAGTNQGTATVLTSQQNVVNSVASGTGVMATCTVGEVQVIADRGANALLVYPCTGAGFEAYGANQPVTVSINGALHVLMTSATQGYVY